MPSMKHNVDAIKLQIICFLYLYVFKNILISSTPLSF